HARRPLRCRVTLHPSYDQMPAIAEGLPFVLREGRVIAGRASREAVVGEGGIVVGAACVQRGHGRKSLGIMRLEAGGDVEQRERRVLLTVLPRREPVVQQLTPQLPAVRGDVLGTFRRECGRPRERRVGARHVADGDVIAAEVVPSGGVRALVVLTDGFAQVLLGFGELWVALIGLFFRSTNRMHIFFYIVVTSYDTA